VEAAPSRFLAHRASYHDLVVCAEVISGVALVALAASGPDRTEGVVASPAELDGQEGPEDTFHQECGHWGSLVALAIAFALMAIRRQEVQQEMPRIPSMASSLIPWAGMAVQPPMALETAASSAVSWVASSAVLA